MCVKALDGALRIDHPHPSSFHSFCSFKSFPQQLLQPPFDPTIFPNSNSIFSTFLCFFNYLTSRMMRHAQLLSLSNQDKKQGEGRRGTKKTSIGLSELEYTFLISILTRSSTTVNN
ncbi:hypothetical protein AMTRI_Chr06g191910 [Amborella trichopoda]